MSWWITRAEQTLTEEVPATPDAVRDFYVDLNRLKDVHPLIVSVRAHSRTQTPDGYEQTYTVRDRIALGPVKLRINYWARLQVPDHGDVITEARQFPRVRLAGTVTFAPTDTGTHLIERIEIAAPRPLAKMTQQGAVNAHLAMLSGIRRHFEAMFTP